GAVRRGVEALSRAHARVLGVVLNGLTERDYSDYQSYYGPAPQAHEAAYGPLAAATRIEPNRPGIRPTTIYATSLGPARPETEARLETRPSALSAAARPTRPEALPAALSAARSAAARPTRPEALPAGRPAARPGARPAAPPEAPPAAPPEARPVRETAAPTTGTKPARPVVRPAPAALAKVPTRRTRSRTAPQ
ncbi:MAG: hypothetical protein ACXWW6_04890, partial [Candidatus Limnocylindrales bacterium]